MASAFSEVCNKTRETYETLKVVELKEACDKASRDYEEAEGAYLVARDSYHKIYREAWANFKP